jgi:hypothetical protein
MSSDLESGVHLLRSGAGALDEYANEPPAWADNLEEAQYALSRIKGKLQELDALHSRHLNRPTMQDSSTEETEIKVVTQEIARVKLSRFLHFFLKAEHFVL